MDEQPLYTAYDYEVAVYLEAEDDFAIWPGITEEDLRKWEHDLWKAGRILERWTVSSSEVTHG